MDGRELGIGRDKAAAFAQAVEANLHVAQLKGRPRLIDKLTGEGERTVGKWIKKYVALLEAQDFSPNTLKQYGSLSRRFVRMLGADAPLQHVTALTISEGLDGIAVKEGKARTAQALRNFARDVFREARVKGWYRGENPVLDTKLSVSVEVKRSRLSLEVFTQARQRCDVAWLGNAMDLALVSGQRRDDIASAEFKAFHDGGWWCVQRSMKGANAHRIFIPLDLRLNCYARSLGDVLAQCRRTGIVSRYLIHQTKAFGNSAIGARIFKDRISKRFSELIASLGIDWGEKQPPTFHEIRSLSERLYAAQGGVNTQELLGHDDPGTTALYHDSRGLDWVRISVEG